MARALKPALAIAGVFALFGTSGIAYAAWTKTTTTVGTLAAAAEFPPVTQLIPSITGTPMTGQLLGYHDGTYTPPATSVTRDWLLCDSAGANCAALGSDPTATLLGAPVANKTIRLRITPKNGSTAGPAATSEPTAPVAVSIGGASPVLLGGTMPSITGTAAAGNTLTAADGNWLLMVSATRQWLRCSAVGAACTPIAGATGTSYVPVTADRGSRLRLRMTANGASSTASIVTSLATSVVP